MNTATPVIDCGGFAGPARAFRVTPPLRDPSNGRTFDHVIVCFTEFGGPRIEVFGGTEHGTALLMNPLPGSCILQHAVSIDDACVWALTTAGGYEIVPPEIIEPEPEPETVATQALPEQDSPQSTPIRVYALAQELGVTSAEILQRLADLEIPITSASANVDPDTAQIIRDFYAMIPEVN